MKIKQFKYSSDNLGYLIYGEKTAMAIDGGAADEMAAFIDAQNLTLAFATHTHTHPDHTSGTKRLVEKTGSRVVDHRVLMAQKTIDLDGGRVGVIHTPGHTDDSAVFFAENFMVTGDTLFNGTIGNCFSGNLKRFYESIKSLMAFPGDTLIYAGHDYVEYAMAFAAIIEPDNPGMARYLKKYDANRVRSTINDELTANPYLRFNDKEMISVLKKQGRLHSTEYQRWESIMSIS